MPPPHPQDHPRCGPAEAPPDSGATRDLLPGLASLADELDTHLAGADRSLRDGYPGERAGRQPVHTVYVPADRYTQSLVSDWGAAALAALDADADGFRAVLGGDPDGLEERVRTKLASEPIEDLRIDFEDGYGSRADSEEDDEARAAARALRASISTGGAPPFHGIRFKSFEAPTRRRGLRTLALFLGELADSGSLPEGCVVTLPKVTSVEQVEAMVLAASRLEGMLGLGPGRCGSRSRWRPRRRSSVRTARRWSRAWCTPHPGAARGCTTAPTTTPRRAASPRSSRAWSTPSPTTPRR